ncbi:hypothetical protein Syun_011710 [Stephania yunnanensis]|uniref:Uncharacterized protein n=1 Tax=Stephania yunnanensis TaxID=152371 RepID=A0AAP0JZ31_9MAGN
MEEQFDNILLSENEGEELIIEQYMQGSTNESSVQFLFGRALSDGKDHPFPYNANQASINMEP